MEHYSLLTQIVLAYLLILAVVFFDFKNRIGVWKELLPTSVSSFIQLLLVAVVILYLVKVKNVGLALLLILVMTFNASFIASRRFKLSAYPKWGVFIAAFVAIAVVNYFLLVIYTVLNILKVAPQQIVPFAGLLLAAGMRSVSLFSQYLKDLITAEKEILEGMFALGSSPAEVREYLLKKAIPLATVVIRDMLKAAGIVHIPGVMVGLLLAGTPPLVAATMQFLVLASMLFSMFFTPIIFFTLLTKLQGIFLEKEETT
ncbi:MAG TPA: ABC transporter permease [Aquifex aeolicus]|uniref:ABC transporter permease n=1 Tax=Aquifex aeolicus TaxID=63363 RepID=A0A9D1CEY2_AQUAO|nr:ABC transporter permease [Aquificales bacterium]HIP98079.1 ABC transporter permease [Aquifex aeolicus]HIQ26475.1 ABC transporter permease [Aquifex aeolicus]